MNIKERLTCKCCNEIFINPITLVCGDSICKHHIDELVSSNTSEKFKCPLCDKENLNHDLEANKLIQELIEIRLHEFKINPSYEAIFNSFKMEIKNFETILKDLENYIFTEISELKRLVDLDREILKNEIDKLADDSIKQLESYEEKFRTEYKTNVGLNYYKDLVESAKKKLIEHEECLSLFSIDDEKREGKCKETKKIVEELHQNYIQLKKNLFSNSFLTYKPMEKNIKDFFGKIILEVSEILVRLFIAFFLYVIFLGLKFSYF